MAYDHGHPPKLTFVNVSIELDDVNDNAPKCAEPIQKVIFFAIPPPPSCAYPLVSPLPPPSLVMILMVKMPIDRNYWNKFNPT